MRIAVKGFRGMAPRVAPHELPPNAAQVAINARLQSGDLEAWRQFLEVERLAITPRTVYLLHDRWLAWESDVDVARAPIPGDDTFRVYLTGPDEYDRPQWTNYSMAFQSPGGTPPVLTRPIGVPASDSAPTLEVGVDPSPTTFSIDTLDDDASLATAWSTNPALNSGGRVALVDQQSGYYRVRYDENRDPGQEAYAYRNFGVRGVQVLKVTGTFQFAGDTGYRQAGYIVGADGTGAGVGVVYEQGVLSIRKPATWGVQFQTAILATVNLTPLAAGTPYNIEIVVVANEDGTKTVSATIFDGSNNQLATLTATNNFTDGDYCGFANGASADAGSAFQTNYSAYHVQASGSVDSQTVNVATSYVFTFVNDLGEQSAPSPPSRTILRPDGVSVTVTTPVGLPTGIDPAYGIEAKRIYRAVTGPTGSIFRFVAEIPLATADYVDTLNVEDLGEALESEDFDLPPDDLQGILALPNGIMVGFRRNQLCFSAQNRPHAWPVAYRINLDTDIVGIGAIDTAVVVGTKSFPYVAQGQTPADYVAAKLEYPVACVSKRSVAYVTGLGVCMATPDGYMAISGVGQPVNITRALFTREQWQALRPETILGIAHDDVLHFWFDNDAAVVSINSVEGPAVNGQQFTLTVTRTGPLSGESRVRWTAAGDLFDGSVGFERVDGDYSGELVFGSGETQKTIDFFLSVGGGSPSLVATVTLSNPSQGTVIGQDVGTMLTTIPIDPLWDDVLLLGLNNGTNADDMSQYQRPVVEIDDPTYSDGALVTGTEQRVRWNLPFAAPSDGLTFEVFCRWSSIVGGDLNQIFGVPLQGAVGNNFRVGWTGATGVWRFIMGAFSGMALGPLADQTWHHLVLEVSDNTFSPGVRLFANGTLVASGSISLSSTLLWPNNLILEVGDHQHNSGPSYEIRGMRVTAGKRYPGDTYVVPTWPLLSGGGG
jgi:hypothetical protein